MSWQARRTLVFILLNLLVPAASASAQSSRPEVPRLFSELEFRSIGPAVTGGRIHDVEALPDDPATVYVATASGGIWKSVNNGTTWTPIFDDQPVSTFGDLAIAPSNPEILYAGTGEQNNRQSTSWGNGVYRSDDGGATWRHLGLDETRHIGKVEIDPTNPDIAYVAALGNLWKANPERGVFKTTDGGRTWEKVLFVDDYTGAVDLVMDPSNPETLYAATYQRLRRTWGFNGGGPGSGIWKTTDGGRNWRRLTSGLPGGDKGRIGLAIARSNPQVLNATIEHPDEGGIYRTENGGRSWEKVSDQNIRPMYYSEIFIDPNNEDRVYRLATYSFRSEDGGRTWVDISARETYDVGVHSDHHGMWIDPNDGDHFYLVGDAGLYETWDRGSNYTRLNNFPIAQFYAIGVDMRDPYWIYGGLQDNHSFAGPSATRHWAGIINDDWREVGFGDGMYWQPDPTSPRYVYGNAQNGSWTRVDGLTGDLLEIEPLAPEGEEYRYDWVSPSLLSQHDPSTIYLGGNRLFISHDRGNSWTRTEDLTRQVDRDTLLLMGVQGADITISRNDGTSSYSEITAIGESPLDAQILWVGTDDGNVQVSRDGGATWTEVSRNVRGVRDGTYVSRVTPSAAAPGVAYATFDAHRDGDFEAYVFKTTDFGRSWTRITDNLQGAGSAIEIIEHPDNPDVLFLGTEHAMYVSLDAGAHWQRFGANLPTTLYDDMLIHPRDKDLVVATHGRAIWILDDVGFLADWSPQVAREPAHIFSIQPATIFQYWKDTSYRGQDFYAGTTAPFGALIRYHLARADQDATIEVAKADGDVVRTLEVPGDAGMIHTVTWDLRHEPPPALNFFGGGPQAEPGDLAQPVGNRGPFVSPGTYTVTLVAGGRRVSQQAVVQGDPEMPITDAQYREREAFLVRVLNLQKEAIEAFRALQDMDPGAARGLDQARGQLRSALRGLSRIASAYNGGGVQQGSLYPPTATHRAAFERVEAEAREAIRAVNAARDR